MLVTRNNKISSYRLLSPPGPGQTAAVWSSQAVAGPVVSQVVMRRWYNVPVSSPLAAPPVNGISVTSSTSRDPSQSVSTQNRADADDDG